MLGRSVGIVASAAVSASAFILPAGIAPADNIHSLESVVNPKNQLLRIPCSACVFPGTQEEKAEGLDNDDEEYVWIQGGANDVVLNFTVTDDGRRLQFDSQLIYPFAVIPFIPTYVQQVPSSSSDADVVAGTARHAPLEVTIQHTCTGPEKVVSGLGDAIIPITLHLAAVEHEQMILDEVSITLLKLGTGELMIMKVENTPLSEPFRLPSLSHPSNDDCRWLPASLCRIKNRLQMDFEKLRSAQFHNSGDRKGKGKGVDELHPDAEQSAGPFDEEDGPRQHQGRPHHMRPHGRHHRHHRHGFFHVFMRRLVAVLVPVVAGITVGLTVSLLGQLIARLIGYLWTNFGGRGDDASARIALLEDTEAAAAAAAAAAGGEGGVIVEVPPKYEEAPAYEENEKIPLIVEEEEDEQQKVEGRS